MSDYHSPDVTLLVGDCRARLAELPARSVHAAITSPPFYGLRAYQGVEPSVWGGDGACAHAWMPLVTPAANGLVNNAMQGETLSGASATRSPRHSEVCTICGAWRGCLGLEPEPFCWGFTRGEDCGRCFLCHLREVFAAVHRVLRDDGSCFVNLGDSYAGSGKGPQGNTGMKSYWTDPETQKIGRSPMSLEDRQRRVTGHDSDKYRAPLGCKAKDLLLIPELFALAMRADGWYVRQRHLGCKIAPMPESVTDRATSAVEYVWHLAKQPRYFYDREGGRETATHEGRVVKAYNAAAKNGGGATDVNDRRTAAGFLAHDTLVRGRNQRNWWLWAPDPFPEAHFAVFPEKLVERFLLVSTSAHGVCATCGAPWERVIGREKHPTRDPEQQRAVSAARTGRADGRTEGPSGMLDRTTTLGWEPTCPCGAPVVVPTVLDPFLGSGTTAVVARSHGRRCVGIDASPIYAEMAWRRLEGVALPLDLAGKGTP